MDLVGQGLKETSGTVVIGKSKLTYLFSEKSFHSVSREELLGFGGHISLGKRRSPVPFVNTLWVSSKILCKTVQLCPHQWTQGTD